MEMQIGCCCTEPAWRNFVRAMVAVGPIDDASVAGYSHAWDRGYISVRSPDVWRAQTFAEAPDSIPSGSLGKWLRKMQPIRFAAYNDDGLMLAMSPYWSHNVSGGVRAPAPTDVGPPADGHFKNCPTSSFIVSVPFESPLGWNIRAKFVRIVVDGIDVSGIVACNGAPKVYEAGVSYSSEAVVAVPITPTDVSGKTIAVDFWIEVDVNLIIGSFSGASWPTSVFASDSTDIGRFGGILNIIQGVSAINVNAKRALVRKLLFEFASTTIGVTSLPTETDGSWTLTRTDSTVRMTHSLRGEYVELDCGGEIAHVNLWLYDSRPPQPMMYVWRYFPEGSGDYPTTDANLDSMPGVFHVATPTVFRLGVFSSSPLAWLSPSLIANLPPHPDTITVGKI